MKPLTNAALHRVQGKLRRAEYAVDAMIRGIENQPHSWTCQDVAALLEEASKDILAYGSSRHEVFIRAERALGNMP